MHVTRTFLSCVPNVSVFKAVWLRRYVSPHSDNAEASFAAPQVPTRCRALVLLSPPTARVALTERCDPYGVPSVLTTILGVGGCYN